MTTTTEVQASSCTRVLVKAGNKLTKEERADIGSLLRQFDTYAPTPRDDKNPLPIESIFDLGQAHPRNFRFFNIANQNVYFIIYDENGRAVASATAVVAVTSRKAQVTIEDVIVLPDYRKQGVGSMLMKNVIDWVKDENVYYFIQLTCSPRRGDWINGWFKNLGFELVASADAEDVGEHATNLYRMSLV